MTHGDQLVLNEGGRLDASPEATREAALVEHDTGQFSFEVAA